VTSVKLFQARNVDSRGVPLKQDGKVGVLTWTALFGAGSVPAHRESDSPFLTGVLSTAKSQLTVREQPRNSNSGPQVNEYLRRVGVDVNLPSNKKPWCCAFTYWCFDEAARAQGRRNPMVRTAGCLDHWTRALQHGHNAYL
jgi:hypothetical protein